MDIIPLGLVASFMAAVILTGLYRRWALAKGWLDHPNNRSSHDGAIPGGAGVVLLLIYASGLPFLAINTLSYTEIFYWCTPLIMGGLGVLDDRVDLSPLIRFLSYAVVLCLAIYAQGSLTAFSILEWGIEQPLLLLAFAVVLLLWWVNLFNFMDGINGIAGFECVFVLLAAMALAADVDKMPGIELSLLLVGSVSGFLLWNFPKAKVFMGDGGSVFLGAFIGLVAVQSALSIWVWGILVGVFFVDASYTLVVRVLQRQQWYQPHRLHAYQILSRRWGSHPKVVAAVMAINILWLFPLAYCAVLKVYYPPLILLIAWLPLIGFCYILRAGSRES